MLTTKKGTSAGLEQRYRARVLADDGLERVGFERVYYFFVELEVEHAAVEQRAALEGALVVEVGELLRDLVGLLGASLGEQREAEVHHHRRVD